MNLCKCALLIYLLLAVGVPILQCSDEVNADEIQPHCKDISESSSSEDEDLIFNTNDLYQSTTERLEEYRRKSRVCLPPPCAHLEAYSGFINVDEWNLEKENSFLFYLYIKKEGGPKKKPLLLWLQGGPGKSSLFGEFLENGPLGIYASGQLYYRNHTLLNQADIIYLDQPVGSGYSFFREKPFNGTLEQASEHIIRFLYRFPLIYAECRRRDLFIGGESYGARFAIGAAMKLLEGKPVQPSLKLKGVMLGVGFLFPLLDIIDSTEYLYQTSLLDEDGKTQFTQRFCDIRLLVEKRNYSAAGILLSETVLNLRTPGSQSLFQMLTGFHHHGSIITPERNTKTFAYYAYANSTHFKKRIHVKSSRTLDGGRPLVARALALGDFFFDQKEILQFVLNRTHVLMYTAQLDDVFPAVNIDREFKNLEWRGSEHFRAAKRIIWHKRGNSSLQLFGYRKRAGALLYANVLFGGHYIFLDRSDAVSELYRRFFMFQKARPPNSTVTSSQ